MDDDVTMDDDVNRSWPWQSGTAGGHRAFKWCNREFSGAYPAPMRLGDRQQRVRLHVASRAEAELQVRRSSSKAKLERSSSSKAKLERSSRGRQHQFKGCSSWVHDNPQQSVRFQQQVLSQQSDTAQSGQTKQPAKTEQPAQMHSAQAQQPVKAKQPVRFQMQSAIMQQRAGWKADEHQAKKPRRRTKKKVE